MKINIIPGQRYMSETEPELGLGLVSDIADKQLTVLFRAADTQRTYGLKTAPLKRVLFQVGDKVKSREGVEFSVESFDEVDGLVVYTGDGQVLEESNLEDNLSFNHPEEKLYNSQVDSEQFFRLRLKTLEHQKKWETSDVKGLLGGRISPIAHQLYVASEVLKRHSPRVLLADEVGLGKTIEAGLIIHKMVTTGRAARVLVVVPDSLVYQWFFEMHRKFQLGFSAINQETPPEPGVNPFLEHERVIVSLGLLKGSDVARDMLAKAEFDILVVDEAHQYKKEAENSFEYELLEQLCERVPSVLLLTATPEQLGMEGHFDRLRLLDPDRYDDFDTFKGEVAEYQKVAHAVRSLMNNELNEDDLKNLKLWLNDEEFDEVFSGDLNEDAVERITRTLIDRHGTGRVFFRNTRQAMRKEYDFFPKRILHPYPLKVSGSIEGAESSEVLGPIFKEKCSWIENFLSQTNEKVLLICHSKAMIVALEKYLKENNAQIKSALFHSGLSLMARDRQAAYFSDKNGAQILLCTEIGSEGRNFEFAQNLVLFDLPKKPDLLEQRIGRLDRIGQKADIHIHVPFATGSWEETLYHIYDEGLDSFKKFSSVGTPVFVHFSKEIHEVLADREMASPSLIKELQKYRLGLEKDLEESRDILIELNSFDTVVGHKIIRKIREIDGSDDLKEYMDEVFDSFGVDVEEINSYATFIRPNDNMYIPHFPHLNKEGQTLTFNRREALEREDYQFLNWDHAMVREVTNLILSESYGNMTVATRRTGAAKKSFVEAFFVLDCPAPGFLDIKRFCPPTLIRVLIDKDGEDFAEKWSQATLDEKLIEADKSVIEKAQKIPKEMLKGLLKKAEESAQAKGTSIMDGYQVSMVEYMNSEIKRLEELSVHNKSISEDDIALMRAMKKVMLDCLEQTQMRLEAVRLII
jgi:ATP-dependent helicase HepA